MSRPCILYAPLIACCSSVISCRLIVVARNDVYWASKKLKALAFAHLKKGFGALYMLV